MQKVQIRHELIEVQPKMMDPNSEQNTKKEFGRNLAFEKQQLSWDT